MRASARGLLWCIAAALSLLGSCSYSPDFANDQLQCGAGKCPKGYSCAADNKCWKDGESPADAGNMPETRLDNFIGTWRFNSGTLDGTCTDGSVIHNALTADDFIVVSRAAVGLSLQYFCETGWNLRLPAGSTTAVALAGQTCRQQTTSGGINTTYNWTATALMFSTTDGRTATTSGHLQGPFTATDNTSGTCEIMFSGPLSKP
jgi:hypothetical protein